MDGSFNILSFCVVVGFVAFEVYRFSVQQSSKVPGLCHLMEKVLSALYGNQFEPKKKKYKCSALKAYNKLQQEMRRMRGYLKDDAYEKLDALNQKIGMYIEMHFNDAVDHNEESIQLLNTLKEGFHALPPYDEWVDVEKRYFLAAGLRPQGKRRSFWTPRKKDVYLRDLIISRPLASQCFRCAMSRLYLFSSVLAVVCFIVFSFISVYVAAGVFWVAVAITLSLCIWLFRIVYVIFEIWKRARLKAYLLMNGSELQGSVIVFYSTMLESIPSRKPAKSHLNGCGFRPEHAQYIEYTFQDKDGNTHTGCTIPVPYEQWHPLHVGDNITILYDPEDPKKSCWKEEC